MFCLYRFLFENLSGLEINLVYVHASQLYSSGSLPLKQSSICLRKKQWDILWLSIIWHGCNPCCKRGPFLRDIEMSATGYGVSGIQHIKFVHSFLFKFLPACKSSQSGK